MARKVSTPDLDLTAEFQTLSPRVRYVAQLLAQQIVQGKLVRGDRLEAIRDMAARHNLSTRGVSLAIEHLERLGLVERIHGSGCYVKGNELSRGADASESVYLFAMMSQPVVMQQIIQPMVNAVQSAGMLMSLVNTNVPLEQLPSPETLRRRWQTRPPRGVLAKDARPPILKYLERLAPPGTRLVTVFQGRSRANWRWHKVEPDEYAGYALATRWLLERGCRRPGMVVAKQRTLPNELFDDVDWNAPFEAVRDTLRDHGVSADVAVHANPSPGMGTYALGLTSENLQQMAAWLSAPDAPDCIIASTVRMESVRMAASMAGRTVGGDLQIIGVGDATPARLGQYPCVSLGHERVAAKAVELVLADAASLGTDVQHITVQPEMVEMSTATPAAGD